jgi:hypothetical protein
MESYEGSARFHRIISQSRPRHQDGTRSQKLYLKNTQNLKKLINHQFRQDLQNNKDVSVCCFSVCSHYHTKNTKTRQSE